MNVLLFGATGMVGQGVLRECLIDPDVERVVSIVRRPTGETHAKLREVVHGDFYDFSSITSDFAGTDACFFCLGVSSLGMSEDDYRRVTYDITIAAASALLPVAPQATFVYVSGSGTDTSERGRIMWARVKGRTENALLAMPFRGAYMFRPGLIQSMHHVRSKTTAYRVIYTVAGPLLSLLVRRFPKYATTSDQIGRAMLHVARSGYTKRFVESEDINVL